MRKAIILFIALIIVGVSYASINIIEPKLNAAQIFFPVGKTGKQISLLELSQISVKDFQTLTGKKMNLVDKIGFNLEQKKLRSFINADGSVTKKAEKFFATGKKTGFHLGGFALG